MVLDSTIKLDKRLKDKLTNLDFVKKAYMVERVEFVADGPGKKDNFKAFKESNVAKELEDFFSTAKKSIIMQTPYLVLQKKEIKFFKKLIKKNPFLNIKVSGNSLAASDHFQAYADLTA